MRDRLAAQPTLGRRRLLVLGAAASIGPACSASETPLGGPYGGTTQGEPTPSVGGPAPTATSGGTSSETGNPGDDGGSTGGCVGGQGMSGGGGGTHSSGIADGGSDGSSGSSQDAGLACSTGSHVLALPFTQYPDLAMPGGSVKVAAAGYSDPNCGLGNIIVIQDSPGHYVALSTSCPHACCEVTFQPGCAWAFTCACHGALFDITGKSAGIKTTLPLPSLPVCSDASGVYVTIA